jgi:hypothetical protein
MPETLFVGQTPFSRKNRGVLNPVSVVGPVSRLVIRSIPDVARSPAVMRVSLGRLLADEDAPE